MISRILEALKPRLGSRTWIISDLQQAIPANSRHCLSTAVEDFRCLAMHCDKICYLGDAVEGGHLGFLQDMSAMQMELLGSTGIPIRYVLGNHDFDYFLKNRQQLDRLVLPFYENIAKNPSWRSIERCDSFYYVEEMGDFLAVFLSDHGAHDGSWWAIHGGLDGDLSSYPYSEGDFERLRQLIAATPKPVLTFSHYSFAGGNRPSDFLAQLLPLPSNVKLHFYGHAHIGDKLWAGKDAHRKIACVDDHGIPQINVSSLENVRGNAIRSVFLETYRDKSFGIYFRNHSKREWDGSFVIPGNDEPL